MKEAIQIATTLQKRVDVMNNASKRFDNLHTTQRSPLMKTGLGYNSSSETNGVSISGTSLLKNRRLQYRYPRRRGKLCRTQGLNMRYLEDLILLGSPGSIAEALSA